MNLGALLSEIELDNSEFSDWGTGKSGKLNLSETEAKLREFLASKSCALKGGSHELVELLRTDYGPGTDTIVRWCSRCGAVVIDLDVDGRVSPGKVVPMKHPELSRAMHALLAEG